LAAWFETEAGITTPFELDLLPDAGPTRCIAISVTGGLGFTGGEQTFDRPTFQLMTRGVNPTDARDLALELDRAFIDAEPGFYLGDFYCVDKGRFGGPPAYVATDDRRRVLRAATYYIEIER
jgi:hypothetical protein